MASLSDQIEAFLRNALTSKATEDQQVRMALRELRPVLNAAEQLVRDSGALAIGPNREAVIQQIVTAVGRNVQQVWGIPMLQEMQDSLRTYIGQQLELGRRMVELSGGTLTTPGAAASSISVQQLVADVVVGGRTLATQLQLTMPAIVADRVERYIRLGLANAGGSVFATYKDAVVTITERNVEAIIRSGVHSIGSAAQQAIYQFETDPAWMDENGLAWTAVLDSRVCPVCLQLDGKRYKMGVPGPYFNGGYKIDPHYNCRCYMLPFVWRSQDMTDPSGNPVEPKRAAEGDNGEAAVGFRESVRDWIRANPETTKAIFGKKLGEQLISGEITLDRAVRQWRAPAAT